MIEKGEEQYIYIHFRLVPSPRGGGYMSNQGTGLIS